MRPRQILALVIGLVIAAIAAFIVKSMFAAPEPVADIAPEPARPAREVLVVREAVKAGDFLRAENLGWQPWPDASPIDFYFSSADTRPEQLAGALARRGFGPGEPITRADILRADEGGFLAAVLKPGMRAVAIRVDAASSTGGLIAPGDLVDVILTNRVENNGEMVGNNRYVSQTVLTAARVVALDQRMEERRGPGVAAETGAIRSVPQTVTLEVTPKDAERLAIAVRIGDLTLSLKPFAQEAPESPVAEAVAGDGAGPVAATLSGVTIDAEVSPVLGVNAGIGGRGIVVMRGSETATRTAPGRTN